MEENPSAQAAALSAGALQALGTTRRWATVTGGAIVAGLVLRVASAYLALWQRAPMLHGIGRGALLAGITAFLALLAIIDIALARYALQYGRRLGGLRHEAGALERALHAQHAFWRLQAALVIVAIALAIVAALVAIAVAALAQR